MNEEKKERETVRWVKASDLPRRPQRPVPTTREVPPSEALLLKDLSSDGVSVSKIQALLDLTPEEGRKALATLLTHLPTLDDSVTRELVVRALTAWWARPAAARPVIEEFLRERNSGTSVRWAIGNALSIVADDSVFDDLEGVLLRPEFGQDREMAVLGLLNMKDRDRALDLAAQLTNDKDLTGHAVTVLAAMKDQRASATLQRFENHPTAWIRREARKGLRAVRSG